MSSIKLCTACRWCRRPGKFFTYYRCQTPQRVGFSPVYGRYPVDRRCEGARKDREDCGLAARWFEPKVSWWSRMLRCIKRVP